MREKQKYSKMIIDAANKYIGHSRKFDEGIDVYMEREAFKEGADWMEHKIMDLECPDYPKEIVEKEIEFVDECLARGIRPTFAGAIQYALNTENTNEESIPSFPKGGDLLDRGLINKLQNYKR